MSDSLLIGMFLLIVLAPCLVAFGTSLEDSELPGDLEMDEWQMPRRFDAEPAPMLAMLPEIALAKDFEIRSFPKGLAQRRIVVRDGKSGVKLTIAQVRAAAVELIKLGGMAAAHEFALVVAASAAAMSAVKDAFAVAAREWLAWGDSMLESGQRSAWEKAPPLRMEFPQVGRRWREVTQAA